MTNTLLESRVVQLVADHGDDKNNLERACVSPGGKRCKACVAFSPAPFRPFGEDNQAFYCGAASVVITMDHVGVDVPNHPRPVDTLAGPLLDPNGQHPVLPESVEGGCPKGFSNEDYHNLWAWFELLQTEREKAD